MSASSLRSLLNVHPRTKRTFQGVLDDVVRMWKYDEVDHTFYNAAYGIAWTVQTCRMGAAGASKLEALSAYQLCGLVAEVAANCSTQNDVPRYLVRKFC